MNKIKISIGISIILLSMSFSTASTAASPSALSLSAYLDQVRQKNLAYASSRKKTEAAQKSLADAELMFTPEFSASLQRTSDKKPNLLFQKIEQTLMTTTTAKISQQNHYGTSGALSLNLSQTEYKPILPQEQSLTTVQLELSQSLWRNFLGREVRAQEASLQAMAESQKWEALNAQERIELQAEISYWNLSFAREALQIQKEAVLRAERIDEWNRRRSQLSLAEKSDALQSRANLEARRLDLRLAEDFERSARRSFNRMRGTHGEEVNENLNSLTAHEVFLSSGSAASATSTAANSPTSASSKPQFALLVPPSSAQLHATKSLMNASRSRAASQIEANRTRVDLFGAIALNGLDQNTSKAFSESFNGQHQSEVIGIRISTPLDWNGATDRAIQSARADQMASEMYYQNELFQERHEWNGLLQRLEDARAELRLETQLEKTQKEKLEAQRDLFRRGRSTFEYVSRFDLEYLGAQAARLKTQAEIMRLLSQMNLFRHASITSEVQ